MWVGINFVQSPSAVVLFISIHGLILILVGTNCCIIAYRLLVLLMIAFNKGLPSDIINLFNLELLIW